MAMLEVFNHTHKLSTTFIQAHKKRLFSRKQTGKLQYTVHTLSQISDDEEDPRLAQTQFHSHHPPPPLVTDNRSEIIVATERTGVM